MIDLEELRKKYTDFKVQWDSVYFNIGCEFLELIDRLQAAESKNKLLDGITQDSIDGGWTALGLSKYTKSLEEENEELRFKLDEMEKKDPVSSQFYSEEENEWYGFLNEQHKTNTINAGYKVRDLYALPVQQHKKITGIELAENELGAWETYLPKITQEIYDRIGEGNNLIETLHDGSWNWTQDAVDFACIIPVNRPAPQQEWQPIYQVDFNHEDWVDVTKVQYDATKSPRRIVYAPINK